MSPRLASRFVALMVLMAGGGVPGALAGEAEKLGTIHFAVPGDAITTEHIVRGVKLLHHMMYVEADREFVAAVEHDPDCGFGYWGRAMALVHPLWPDIPTGDDIKRGEDLINAGLSRPARDARERAYLATMAVFFRDPSAPSYPARLKSADEAWAKLSTEYPDDLDAAAFAALFHLAPARFTRKDASNRLQIEAATSLDRILRIIPDHPGALHYKIHALDFPLLAGRALEVCDLYGEIAPDVPHALHMPTHIFTRRGEWEKSIDFNERSAIAARNLARADGATNSHLPHALDYLAYAYLQRGQYAKVRAILDEVGRADGPYQPVNRPAMAFAFAAIPARYALERRDWKTAAHLPLRQPASFPWSDSFLYCDSMVRFARALGAIRSGDLDAARGEIVEQEKIAAGISASIPGSYWAAEAEVQLLTTRAWLTLTTGEHAKAIELMRQAVALESTVDKEAVTPGEVLPAGELLGELLVEVGRYDEAVTAFSIQLSSSPNRFNGLYGAGHAAELAGDRAGATRYYQQLLLTAVAADPGNDRLAHAVAFLAKQRDVAGRAEGVRPRID
jgi:tetratricopeptide (TPR) repeat protein